ncbi:hypothetical protein [Amycolatopsis sp. lyj-23]|uniref:hypothetical protein n=1 Tax=Amycolatopsis sp. lyj-23 TaxID=2789283 RepID=UPI00397E5FC6
MVKVSGALAARSGPSPLACVVTSDFCAVQAVLPHAGKTDIYLTAPAVLLTLVHAAGLLFRPRRRIGRMGVGSLVVLVL